jgi:predicted GNAT superfamily acetyltransferase
MKHGIGRKLYNEFFNVVKKNGRNIVRCVTSPVNKVSIAFKRGCPERDCFWDTLSFILYKINIKH